MTEHPAIRFATALVPLALTPALGSAINAGTLNFGGGEKDIILLIPWVLWSLAYAVAALVYWRRRVRLGSSLLLAFSWATGLTLALGLMLTLLAPHFIGLGATQQLAHTAAIG